MEIADVGKSLGMTSVVFFLTSWGMVSFVKGATKTRIIQAGYTTPFEPKALVENAIRHFTGRGYKINKEADTRPGVITFEGMVSPSVTIAAILLACSASSLASVILILKTYYPDQFASNYLWLAVLPSVFVIPWYWQGAERTEQVKMLVETEGPKNKLWLKGHRDELQVYEAEQGMKRDEVE